MKAFTWDMSGVAVPVGSISVFLPLIPSKDSLAVTSIQRCMAFVTSGFGPPPAKSKRIVKLFIMC